MRSPKRVAPTPLLDRLVSREPSSLASRQRLSALDYWGLHDSIARELSRILNSRARLPRAWIDRYNRTIVDYGVRDHLSLDPQSAADRYQLASELENTITAFEPRLRDVRIVVDEPEELSRRLIVRIMANLMIGHVKEPLMFQLAGEQLTEVRKDE